MTGTAHPLSQRRISLGDSNLAVPGLQLAAVTATGDAQALTVEEHARALLNSPDAEIANGAALALVWLGNHPAAMTPADLAFHPHVSVRRLAAARWAAGERPDPAIGARLARDPDFRVRLPGRSCSKMSGSACAEPPIEALAPDIGNTRAPGGSPVPQVSQD